MKRRIVGIIAEYNPLHHGHRYQLETARQALSADGLVVAMSGDFVQRGIPAVASPYERARDALICGADMVVTLPVTGSVSSARDFANAGVGLLSSLGIVTDLVFGAEDVNNPLFNAIAEILLNEPDTFKEHLLSRQRAGDNFAKARAHALSGLLGPEVLKFVEKPNNILGIEYVRAMRELDCSFSYTPLSRDFSFESSTTIRGRLSAESPEKYLFEDDFSLPLHIALLNHEDYSNFYECTDELSHRIINMKSEFTGFSDFADLLKSKNMTRARIMRCLCHIMLGITREDAANLSGLSYAPYIHVLGIKKGSEWMLSALNEASSAPVITSVSQGFYTLSSNALNLFHKDLYAHNLYRAVKTRKTGSAIEDPRSRRFLVV